jgi:nucleotide-binding universal stress UspA family protein
MAETVSETRRRIVVGVDSSDNAARAAAWAASEAAHRGLALHLVHALDFPALPSAVVTPIGFIGAANRAGENLLDPIGDGLRTQYPHLTVTTEVSDLSAPEALVALSGGADLVVTGTRGHGGFAGLLLGSVSLKLAAHALCPAVVVRGTDATELRDEIVLGVEPDQAEAPIRFAFATAAALGARVRVVRAWTPHPSYAGYYYAADGITGHDHENDVADLLKSAREEFPDVPVVTDIKFGNAVPTLVEAAAGAHLLVVGAHRHRSPLSVGIGYVVQGLLSHSPTPVAVVPIA